MSEKQPVDPDRFNFRVPFKRAIFSTPLMGVLKSTLCVPVKRTPQGGIEKKVLKRILRGKFF